MSTSLLHSQAKLFPTFIIHLPLVSKQEQFFYFMFNTDLFQFPRHLQTIPKREIYQRITTKLHQTQTTILFRKLNENEIHRQ